MGKRSLLMMLALVACTGGEDVSLDQPPPDPEPIPFRVIEEAQNPTFCVEGPEFEVITSDDAWVAAYSRQSDCQSDGEFMLPPVRFDDPGEPEIVIAAWWRVEGCLGFDVTTTSVARVGADVVVTAETSGPGEGQMCATALGGLESFLAVRRDQGFDGAAVVRFVIDGVEVGTADVPEEGGSDGG